MGDGAKVGEEGQVNGTGTPGGESEPVVAEMDPQDKVEEQVADDANAVHRVSVLQKDESICIDLTGELAREIFMHLKIRLEKSR